MGHSAKCSTNLGRIPGRNCGPVRRVRWISRLCSLVTFHGIDSCTRLLFVSYWMSSPLKFHFRNCSNYCHVPIWILMLVPTVCNKHHDHMKLKRLTSVQVLIQLQFKIIYFCKRESAVAQWLRCCDTNRKVAGSIPSGVVRNFHWHKILPIAL